LANLSIAQNPIDTHPYLPLEKRRLAVDFILRRKGLIRSREVDALLAIRDGNVGIGALDVLLMRDILGRDHILGADLARLDFDLVLVLALGHSREETARRLGCNFSFGGDYV